MVAAELVCAAQSLRKWKFGRGCVVDLDIGGAGGRKKLSFRYSKGEDVCIVCLVGLA